MKKLIITILILLFLAYPVFGALNSHSLDLEAGSSQYANTADSADLSITALLSVEFWVKFESQTGNFGLVSKENNAGSYDWTLVVITNNSLRLYIDGNTDYYTVTFNNAQWYHIAFTFDASQAEGSKTEFYIDGTHYNPSVSDIIAASISDSGYATQIGFSPVISATGYLDGLIDDVRIWNDIRTEAEIDDNKSVQLNGNDTGLMAYWMLNNNAEDKGEITDPAGTAANDLTLVNTPTYQTDVPFAGEAAAAEVQIVPGIIEF